MRIRALSLSTVTAGLVGISLLACGGKVDEEVFDEEMAEVRERLAAHDTALADADSTMTRHGERLDDLDQRVESLRSDLEDLREEYGARIERLQDGLQFAMPVHFGFDSAEVRSSDREKLQRFASVVGSQYGDATVTVEGFADPAGPEAYNRRLSQRRAEAVARYLTEQAGMASDRVRAVGYGESRLVRPNAMGPGEEGRPNRRVTFVVEFTGDDA